MATKRVSVIGGKFNSTGDATAQRENRNLVTRLHGEIMRAVDGRESVLNAILDPPDREFLRDTGTKLRGSGNVMFGWRQVEAMVRVHGKIQEVMGNADDGRGKIHKGAKPGADSQIRSASKTRGTKAGA